jgi:rod shape-determining protein MreC
MQQFIRIFLTKFKEYIVLISLLILSLILITTNDNSKVKNVRLFALGLFASVNSSIISLGHFLEDTDYIESLEKNNADLMLQINKLRSYALENQELNKVLNFKSSAEYELVTAKIVSRLVSKINGYFIIAKGKLDGIEEGMPVITDKGLVGIVFESTDNYSSVRTYENSLFKVAVKNQRSNIDGVLNWDGKNLLMKNVPTTYDVELGDRIIVSELSSILPPSIPVGLIIEKESTLSGVLSNLKVKPFVELNSIRNVIVIKSSPISQLDSLSAKILGVEK